MIISLTRLSAAFGLVAILIAPANAQNATSQQRAETKSDRAGLTGQIDSKTQGATVRASQLMGLNVYNKQGESIAEINDIVLDTNSGRVLYAAVTYGGVFGLGDKLFAVPFQAFKAKQDRDNPDDVYLTLNVSEKQLEGAKGFDQDNWPNFADKNFVSQLNERYNVRMKTRNRDRDIRVDVNRNGVDVDVERE